MEHGGELKTLQPLTVAIENLSVPWVYVYVIDVSATIDVRCNWIHNCRRDEVSNLQACMVVADPECRKFEKVRIHVPSFR